MEFVTVPNDKFRTLVQETMKMQESTLADIESNISMCGGSSGLHGAFGSTIVSIPHAGKFSWEIFSVFFHYCSSFFNRYLDTKCRRMAHLQSKKAPG